jgi:hypothetical protein
LRAAARAECDAMLQQARARSREIEVEARLRSHRGATGLEDLAALRGRVSGELRAALEEMISLGESVRLHPARTEPPASAAETRADPAS